jgi:predicted transcriptional regulator of viral defense system
MNYQEFRKTFFDLACFTPNQVYAWRPDFDKNNLLNWVKKGYLIKLRNGFYSFPEYLAEPGFDLFIANRIYRPSFISLHSALSFYGMIPEAVVQITSVTTLKTVGFVNHFGTFSYQSIHPGLMFGYDLKPHGKNRSLMIAQAEKALLDLLYLNPFYNSHEEMEALRFDEDFMHDDLDVTRLKEYAVKFKNLALEKRLELLIKAYDL